MSVKFQSDSEISFWKSVYQLEINKADPTKNIEIIRGYSLIASQVADNAVYEFRARAGNHSQILPVINGTIDSEFQTKHSESPFDN